MPSSVTITPRKLFKEDLQLTTNPNAAASNQTVLGLGTVALNPVDAVLYSSFTQASNDTNAGTGGVDAGEVYYNTTRNRLKAKASAVDPQATAEYVTSNFDFSPITPGGSLSIGLNVIDLGALPSGISSATSPNAHYLYISGGTGTAEPVLVKAVSGTTVTVQCAYNHTGAWTIRSASAGIQEAFYYGVSSNVKIFVIPGGTFTLNGTIFVPDGTTLRGCGSFASVLTRTGDYGDTFTMGSLAYGGVSVNFSDFTVNHLLNYNSSTGTIVNKPTVYPDCAHFRINGLNTGSFVRIHARDLPYCFIVTGGAVINFYACVTQGLWVRSNAACQVTKAAYKVRFAYSTFKINNATLTNISVSGGVATATTSSPHGAVPNGLFQVKNSGVANLDALSYRISSIPTPNSFTFPVVGVANGTYTTAGMGILFHIGIPTYIGFEDSAFFGNFDNTAAPGNNAAGPKYMWDIESAEDLWIKGGGGGGAAYNNLRLNPNYDSLICSNIRVSDVKFDSAFTADIEIASDGTANCADIVISDNIFNGETTASRVASERGIYVPSNGGGAVRSFAGLIIDSNIFTYYNSTPIVLEDGTGFTIKNNLIKGYNQTNSYATASTASAIYCGGSNNYGSISNNMVGGGPLGTAAASYSVYGISIQSPASAQNNVFVGYNSLPFSGAISNYGAYEQLLNPLKTNALVQEGSLLVTDTTGRNGSQLIYAVNASSSPANYAAVLNCIGASGNSNTGMYLNVRDALNENIALRIVNTPAGSNNFAIYADAPAKNYFAGKVAIGNTNPTASTAFEVNSTTGAVLLPRLTTAERNNLTAINGMIIYNSTDNKFQGYEGGAWANLI